VPVSVTAEVEAAPVLGVVKPPVSVVSPVTPSVPGKDILPEVSSVAEALADWMPWPPAPVMMVLLDRDEPAVAQVAQAIVPVEVMVPPVMGEVVAMEVTPAVVLISTRQRCVEPCLSVAYWPVPIVKLVAPVATDPPSSFVKVSEPLRLKVKVPALTSSTVSAMPAQPEAVESGTVTVPAPLSNSIVVPRSTCAVELSHWMV